MGRTFEDHEAVRERSRLLIALVGPSSSGKTYSALRLGTGIQKVVGGELFVIDTEGGRSKDNAWDPKTGHGFKFRWVALDAPFGPLDYLGAVDHCVARGARTIVIDSMSHEHEGPGGVLEQHMAETKRLARAWNTTEDKAKMSAWQKPKSQRRQLINRMVQLECNFVLCFRAKKKLGIKPGEKPVDLGLMHIGGDDFLYEMTMRALLPAGARGVPRWEPDGPGERIVINLPEHLQRLQLFRSGEALSETHGEKLARWAEGSAQAERASTVVPSFSADFPWTGREQWGGRPLAEAPIGDLAAYGDALRTASGQAKPKTAAKMREHLAQVEAVLQTSAAGAVAVADAAAVLAVAEDVLQVGAAFAEVTEPDSADALDLADEAADLEAEASEHENQMAEGA